jgi:hypothetical protein
MEKQFNFLRVKDGRTYFARVAVASDLAIEGVRLSANAGSQNPDTAESWLEAARLGAGAALNAHIGLEGGKIGLTVTSVLGTEVDTSSNTVEIAAFCASWEALGHSDSELILEFDHQWRVRRRT